MGSLLFVRSLLNGDFLDDLFEKIDVTANVSLTVSFGIQREGAY